MDLCIEAIDTADLGLHVGLLQDGFSEEKFLVAVQNLKDFIISWNGLIKKES